MNKLPTLQRKLLTSLPTIIATTVLGASLLVPAATRANADLTEIIVTAKGEQRLSDSLVTAHVLDDESIKITQAKDLTTLLAGISGVNITDSGGRGSTTGVFLRGASSSQTIVLVDGVRVGSATLGAAALNSYPVEAIERVEVVKGPLSGIYGADAVGGVIQLFTRKGGTENGLGSVSAAVGSDSLREYGFALHGGNEKHSYHFSAFDEETVGIDRTSIETGGNDDRDGFTQTAFSFGGRSQLGENTFANLSVLYTDSSVEFDNTFGDDSGFYTDTETFSGALNITTNLNPDLRWNTTLGSNQDNSLTPAFSSEFDTQRDSISTEFAYRLNDSSNLTLGADYYQEKITPLETFPVSERDNKGVFALWQKTFSRFGLVSNLRYDDNSAYGSDTNGSFAINYHINDSVRAVASYGTAFVAPSFNLLYFPFFGNPELLPEESKTAELSLLGTQHRFNWRVSAYQTKIENLFSFDPNTFLAANVGSADISGVEFDIAAHVGDWQLQLYLDLLAAKNDDTGIELDDRAQKKATLSAVRHWDNLTLRLAMDAESDRFDNAGTELSSFALFAISGRYQLHEQLSISAAIDNLFDKDYTVNLIGANERYRSEGRQARVKLQYNF